MMGFGAEIRTVVEDRMGVKLIHEEATYAHR